MLICDKSSVKDVVRQVKGIGFVECVQWKIFKISLVSVVQFACNNYTMHSSPSAILNSYKMTKHSVCDQHSIINFEILYIQCAL